MKKEAKIKSLEKIEINHDDWCVILQGLKLEEQRLREYAFYSGVKTTTISITINLLVY